jgi:hypothetical protein
MIMFGCHRNFSRPLKVEVFGFFLQRKKRLACLLKSGFVSPPICQALPGNAGRNFCDALRILDSNG